MVEHSLDVRRVSGSSPLMSTSQEPRHAIRVRGLFFYSISDARILPNFVGGIFLVLLTDQGAVKTDEMFF